jgi:trehalose-phosphatase
MKYCLSTLQEVEARVLGASRVLIATDFDGTLCPIAGTPSEARLAPATLEILRRAADCQRLTLAVISGRALADIRGRLPLDVVFVGNHGLEIAGAGLDFEHDGARQLRPVIARACDALRGVCLDWPAAWIEDKGLSATLHFRNVDQCQHTSLLFAARHSLGAFGPALALRMGNRALEVRTKVCWDKGSALQYIQDKAGPFDTTICIGDDRTDECMFRANRDQLNIRVGCLARSAATHYLSDPAEVAILLSYIVGICGLQARSLWMAGGALPKQAAAVASFGNCQP